MKKLTLICMLIFATATNIFAQTQGGSIKGKIADGGQQAVIDAATVSLFRASDSALIKVTLTDKDGSFAFESIVYGDYFLMATSVGHGKKYSESIRVFSETPVDAGILQLEPVGQNLKEVVITREKPFIERKIDRTVINVSNSITSAGSNALEVLEKSPGVTVDKDGKISLKGKDGVMVMMDGRPTYLNAQELSNLLKNMPASGIEQIEIMTNPSAKYDASGNSGVINIKTVKNKIKGTNGSISLSGSQSKNTRTSNSLNLNYRNGQINLFGNYSFSLWQNEQNMNLTRKFRNQTSKEIETIFDQQSQQKYFSPSHNVKIGMDFYASKKTTLGFVLTGYYSPETGDGLNTTYLKNKLNNTDSIVVSSTHSKESNKNLSANLNLRHQFDSTGKDFTLDLDFVTYDKRQDNSLTSDYLNPDYSKKRPSNILIGALPSKIKIYSLKADFTFPLSATTKLETGVKSSYVTTDNDAVYHIDKGSGSVLDYSKTNHFLYDENINAAYINFNTQVKKWGFQLGLRAENTNAKGKQFGNPTQPDSSFTKNYVNLFPTAYVTYQLNEKNTFSANFGRRVDRPNYADLNPFIYFLDEFTYNVGNTLLQPQFTNNFELSHTYSGFLTTTINYSKTKNAFSDVIKQITSERKTFQTKENIATKTNYGISVSAGFPLASFWNANIYTNLTNNHFKGELNGGMLDVENWLFFANMNHQFKLGKGWNAELSGFYRGKGIEGQIVVGELWRMDAGIQKQILDKKGTLKLSVRDIFNSMNTIDARVNYQDIDLNLSNKRESRFVSLTFAYRFGKPLKTPQRKVGGASDELKRIQTSNN